MRTITVDILNDEALNLLKGLEALHIIRVHTQSNTPTLSPSLSDKYKGKMTRQTSEEIESQLKELRDSWD